jgi:LCP family protein required for cell wall assembly
VTTRRYRRPPYPQRAWTVDRIAEKSGAFFDELAYRLQMALVRKLKQTRDEVIEQTPFVLAAIKEWLCYNFAPMEPRRSSINPRAAARRRVRQSSGLPNWAVYALGGFFVFAALFAAYLVFVTARDFAATQLGGSTIKPAPNGSVVYQNTPGPGGTAGASDVGPAATLIPAVKADAWNGTDRVTILMMGIDQRVGETDTAYRTDSMMLLTLDPVGRSAGMLSIPRDLYVEIPGFPGRDKITTANFKGDAYHLPGGGPQLAMDTVEQNLGIRVNYYIRINFTAFETFIDLIGGIDVNNPTEINDPEYPDMNNGYDPFYLAAGPQHLDGRTALKFARTRHQSGDDFGRAQRQQLVVLAVRDRILSANMLPVLFGKAPELLSTLNGSYETNLSLNQIASLALLAKDIPRDKIVSKVIDQEYIADFYTTQDNQQVVILNIEKFRVLRDSMFYVPEPAQLNVPNAAQLLGSEAARVEVQNGTATGGLAATVADYLKSKGVNVTTVGNADKTDYASTVIIDYTGKPYTAKWLADTFHISSSSILAGNDPSSKVDVRIILGADFVLPSQ